MTGLQTHHARHQFMVIGNRAPSHERRNHRDAGQFGKLNEFRGRIGIDDATARDDDRPGSGIEHTDGLLGLRGSQRGAIDGERRVSIRVELNLCELHIDR